MILIKEFEFDSAHFLPKYHGKCENLHGHTYKMVVKLEGTPDAEGMIMDFIMLKNLVKEKIINKLDHALINDIIPQPSAENIAVWTWEQLVNDLQKDNCRLYEIEVWETKTSGVIYNGK